MSPVIVDDIRIAITYDNIVDDTKGIRKIKKALHDCILTGIQKCIFAGIELAKRIVPESAARPGRYGDKYESEKLMLNYINFLTSSLLKLSIGRQTLKRHYLIGQEWSASYAEHVNFMGEDTDWSKKTSKRLFIETLDDFLRGNMMIYIQNELDEGAPSGTKLLFSVS